MVTMKKYMGDYKFVVLEAGAEFDVFKNDIVSENSSEKEAIEMAKQWAEGQGRTTYLAKVIKEFK